MAGARMSLMTCLVVLSLGLARAYSSAEGVHGSHWAVLVAGSNSWYNYRHQADVCHAYQLVRAAGIPKEHIIVMAYDDVANASQNRDFPGQIFNKPTPAGTPGVDVYAGCEIDYRGPDVNPETFTKVLTGVATGTGSGKVLRSTRRDKVFVNFVDHGAVGMIGFPRVSMHAKELLAALDTMHEKQMYGELVFYLEACESGSMFENLPNNTRIYATTAANRRESSWGTYCEQDSMVDGKLLNTCLGDLYSVSWMEDSDSNMARGETIGEQTSAVTKLVTKSHVEEFGNLLQKKEETHQYQGNGKIPAAPRASAAPTADGVARGTMRSADATLWSMFATFVDDDDDDAGEELIAAVQDRLNAKKRFQAIARAVAGDALTAAPFSFDGSLDIECHYAAHRAHASTCHGWSAGSMSYSGTIAALCEHTRGDAKPIVAAIEAACK